MIQRDYFFEFAGMPQGGKSTIWDSVAHFLKRNDIPIGLYSGSSAFSPLYNSTRASLNLSLACKVVDFVTGAIDGEKTQHRVFLLDSGLIDRYFFTNTLLRCGEIDKTQAERISAFLTLPHLLDRMDGIFIFVVSPEVALQREYQNKIIQSEGGVMNMEFLSTIHSVAKKGYDTFYKLVKNVRLIDTEHESVQKTARDIATTILNEIEKNGDNYKISS